MKTLPTEFRYRVVALTDDGMTTGEIAGVLGVSGVWVRSIKALHRSGVSLEPKSRANNRTSLAEREGERIRSRSEPTPAPRSKTSGATWGWTPRSPTSGSR